MNGPTVMPEDRESAPGPITHRGAGTGRRPAGRWGLLWDAGMRRMAEVEVAEHRATLPAEVGFECTFYEGLFYRTARLRDRLYVTVAAGGGEFRPRPHEHFPRDELARYQARGGLANAALFGLAALGEGEPVELVFRCHAPAWPEPGGASEGAKLIAEGIRELEARAGLSEWARTVAAMRDRRRFGREHGAFAGLRPRYRPPRGTLPEREGPPEPAAPFGAEAVEEKLRSWGFHGVAARREAMRKGGG